MGPGTDTERLLFRKPHRDAATSPCPPAHKSDQSLFRKNTLDEMTVGRTEKPVTSHVPEKPILTRAKPGVGSYEDPADEKRQKRRTKGKTGRHGGRSSGDLLPRTVPRPSAATSRSRLSWTHFSAGTLWTK